MTHDPLFRKLGLLLSAAMLVAGVSLALWAVTNIPGQRTVTNAQMDLSLSGQVAMTPTSAVQRSNDQALSASTLTTTVTVANPLVVGLDTDLPDSVTNLVAGIPLSSGVVITAPPGAAVDLKLSLDAGDGEPAHELVFAAATRFDVIPPAITWEALNEAWAGEPVSYTAVAVLSDTLPALAQVLGPAGPTVRGRATMTDVIAAAWGEDPILALVPFDELAPSLAVLAIDGQNPVNNANEFDATKYPFVATVYAHLDPAGEEERARVAEFLAALPPSNRLDDRLTVIAMTGVTAMVRQTAAQMERLGAAWPAEVIGPELAKADLTHISNEVPFVPGCPINTDPDNLTFCSPPEFMEALTASGVDIIGLTGNHQNDFGRDDALKSLDIYKEAGLPVYGGGANKEEAFKPLIVEHNGNRIAFLGANSYGPAFAWATDTQPGSAQFDLAILSATIRNLKAKGLADVVMPELQYQESYDVKPLFEQRQDFKALVRAGADIVTGVQSHVPQGVELFQGKLILYGLGNLFFDQMWSEATREGIIAKHTIYAGRHLSTQLLTTRLHEYGQPRWATPAERVRILKRVFGASYWE